MQSSAFVLLAFFLCSATALEAQTTTYDSVLAAKFHADERGMHMYVLAILKTGPVEVKEKAAQDSLFRGHMANITRLSEAGLLSVAGPFERNDKGYRGIFVLNVPTIAEAKKLVVTDPAVKAGIFEFDLFEWYGTAAMEALPELHKKLQPNRR